jgi:hypothetical protein
LFRREKKKQFFFEKKNQKTFAFLACAAGESRDSDIKVFCFFSSEKKALLSAHLRMVFESKISHSALNRRCRKKYFGCFIGACATETPGIQAYMLKV